jgi:hypothetical protein
MLGTYSDFLEYVETAGVLAFFGKFIGGIRNWTN